MVARKKLAVEAPIARKKIVGSEVVASSYFADTAGKADGDLMFSTGCAVLDAMIGGGYMLGRTTNICGDRASGKTLNAIEAIANFLRKFSDGYSRYAEAESAFDIPYAKALGIPVDKIDFKGYKGAIHTIEDFFEDAVAVMDAHKDVPVLYILDSLDALSDRAESERSISDNTYGGTKAKKLGEIFRRLVQRLESQRVCLIVISQLRDKLNVTFGERQQRSGGRALDYYASQIIWLYEVEKLKKVVGGITRIVGIQIRAKTKKNKVGLNYRQCDYPILFGYGIDDLTANVEWLLEHKRDERLAELGLSKAGYKIRLNSLRNKGGAETVELRTALRKIVFEEWAGVEATFLPTSSKY